MSAGVFLLLTAVLLVLGIPVSFAMASSSVLFIILNQIPGAMVMQKMFAGVDSTALLCIPFFILAGDLMSHGGIGGSLIYLCKRLIGNVKGGLCYVTIIACTFFAAVTGSAVACCAALGVILIPEMEKDGYPRDFSTAIVGAGSTLGPIIPPSISLVVYGSITYTSISDMYMVGVPAGIIIALSFCLLAYVQTRRRHFVSSPIVKIKDMTPEEKVECKKKMLSSAWALGMPVIILGGIFGGVCTPTEASAIAVLYAIIVGLFVYKDLKLRDIPKYLVNSCKSSARIIFIIACSTLFTWIISYAKLPQTILAALMTFSTSKYLFIMIMVVVSVILGMFIDGGSIILITIPVFYPMMKAYGVDPVHAGVFLTALYCLGTITPPFGTVLFTGSNIGGISVGSMTKQLLPYIFVMFLATMLFTLIPDLIMWII